MKMNIKIEFLRNLADTGLGCAAKGQACNGASSIKCCTGTELGLICEPPLPSDIYHDGWNGTCINSCRDVGAVCWGFSKRYCCDDDGEQLLRCDVDTSRNKYAEGKCVKVQNKSKN